MHRLSGDRVREIKFPGVQCLARQREGIVVLRWYAGAGRRKDRVAAEAVRVVEGITRERVPEVRKMNADLVGAAGLQLQLQHGKSGKRTASRLLFPFPFRNAPERPVVSDGAGAALIVDRTQDQRSVNPGDRQVDGAFVREKPFRGREVRAVNFASLQRLFEDAGGEKIFRDDQKPGRIAVESVDAAEYKRDVFLGKIVGEAVPEGVRRMADGRVDCLIHRFVDDQKVFILVENREGNRSRYECFGRFFIPEADSEGIAGGERMTHEDMCSVQQDRFRIRLHRSEDMAGVSFLTEEAVDVGSGVCFCYFVSDNSFHDCYYNRFSV